MTAASDPAPDVDPAEAVVCEGVYDDRGFFIVASLAPGPYVTRAEFTYVDLAIGRAFHGRPVQLVMRLKP